MLSVMLYFSGSHMPQKGDYAPAYATFRCLRHILFSDFGVKYALKRRLCYCCIAVSFPAYLLWFLVVTSYFIFHLFNFFAISNVVLLLNTSMHA